MYPQKHKLTKQLSKKLRQLQWPGLPSTTSDLYEPACELMEKDTFLAGCFQKIISHGSLDEKYWQLLAINEGLTHRIANTDDAKTLATLAYKQKLDECIQLAQKIVQLK